MGTICDYDLWVLGDEARSVIPHLMKQGWRVVKESEMGVHFELRSGYLHLTPPHFSDELCLLVVMSGHHDLQGDSNHYLFVSHLGHGICREWSESPDGLAAAMGDTNEAVDESGSSEASSSIGSMSGWQTL